MSDLKPCPFCGSTDIDSEPNTDTYGSVCCNKCGFGSPYGEISIMIEHWNSRPLEDALRSRIAELEKSAIVWHRYPEEKPERPMGTLVNRLVDWFTMLILYKDKNGNRFVGRDTYHWWEDDDPAFETEMDESITVIGFAYLPAPPEETK